ncbi:hypothetical protein KHF85_07320 [Xanthomonas translucens pv. graminis]|uniref:hypothetical protein n=1 Tax=Xanthomonas TaxID=338 RepID=UPI001981603D|nr:MULTISPECIES: hypothetical protein [Xanthomonas]MBN6111196.1 hypothetical protein [Xanthomonas bonasiae]WIH06229.1 hypothetical protein KHF85_07320 [Xanthomonas translucens pv. graminis]
MNAPGFLGFTVLPLLGLASCGSSPRIDGSSYAAFQRSHAAVMAALSPQDRMRFTLAELIVLSPKGCLATKPIPDKPVLDKVLGGQADLSTCRKELDGLTFKDIMSQAYPQGETAGGGAPGAA